jgi:DNA polymerase III delta prime subunit
MANFDLHSQQIDTQYIAGQDISIYQQVVPLTLTAAQQKRNRIAMLERVRSYWIKGVLERSLSGTSLALGLSEHCDVVANDRHMNFDDSQFCDLLPGTPLLQVFTHADDELLILGEPGSGKTTLLLELARDLLDRATHDETYPIPVVFNLSSWALKHQPLSLWLVEELEHKYMVPRRLAISWVINDQLLPILDGLDEVATGHRHGCVEAINTYHHEHGLVPLVISCRSADYNTLQVRLQVHHTVVVQPLTTQQIDDYLTRVGEPAKGLHLLMQNDPALQELATTPLLLNILTRACQDKRVEDLALMDVPAAQRQRILAHYVQRMLQQKEKQMHYQQSQVLHWLAWLARQLTLHSQTEFSIEQIQPDWLTERQEQRVYECIGVRLPGVLFGVAVSPIIWIVSSSIKKTGTANSLYYIILVMFIGGLIGGLFSQTSTRRRFERNLTPALVVGLFIMLVAALLYKLRNASSLWLPALGGGSMLGLGSFLLTSLVLNGFVGKVETDIKQGSVTTGSLKALWSPLLKAGHVKNGVVIGLVYGLAFWLDDLVSRQPSFVFLGGPVYGLILGISGIILSVILSGKGTTIQPVEVLVWSWSAFRSSLANLKHLRNGVLIGTACGFICGLGTGLRMGPSFILNEGLIYAVSDGIAVGLGYWLFVALLQGVSGAVLDEHQRITPNQGIQLSVQNGLFMGFIGACMGGVLAFLGILLRYVPFNLPLDSNYVRETLVVVSIVGLTGGLIAGLLNGWLAYIRHVVLRILLLRAGAIPAHYSDFLDEAAARIILRKIGSSYIFIHRLLLDYFAKAETQVP